MENKIDFVILWVDGGDEKWLKEKEKYDTKVKKSGINGISRYRDWDNLKYWFRGVEKYAPWVNNIYFLTWGHLPKWLDTSNPKLKIINHKDYIPKKYLPTFSSNPIELNIHRIEELSEHFILFNDDMFFIDEVTPSDFFKKGLPVDNYNEVNWDSSQENPVFASILKNNYRILDKYYNKRKIIMKKPFMFINYKYGVKRNLQNIKTTITKKNFVGITSNHIPQSFLKSYFKKLWELEPQLLDEVSSHKFRSPKDINQYLIKEMQLMDYKFVPRDFKLGKYFCVSNDNSKLINVIKNKECKIVCINDGDSKFDFEKVKDEINLALETNLCEKCSYEK